MKKIITHFRVDARKHFVEWDKFHDYFAKTFQFPDYYGRNMNAWNDCMSDYCYDNGLVLLHIDNAARARALSPKIFKALTECSAFINWRETEKGDEPLIVLSYRL